MTHESNRKSKNHPFRQNKWISTFFLLFITLILSSCFANQGQFDEEGNLTFGDLQVTILESGSTRVYEGFVCDDDDFQHPFVTLQLSCSEETENGCHITFSLAVKYEDGASWGRTSLSSSSSPTDFQPKTLFLEPGESRAFTFHPNSAVRQCWSIRESVKRITVVLRDETGVMKDMQANFTPE